MGSGNVRSCFARILVIEKCTDLRIFITNCLRNAGHEVLEATDAETGIGLLRTTELPDVIFLDWQTPSKNGKTFLTIRDHSPDLVLIPVVVIMGPELEEINSPNVSSVLKPVDRKILLEIANAAAHDRPNIFAEL